MKRAAGAAILLFAFILKAGTLSSGLFPINWTGTEKIRNGNFDAALAEVLADSVVPDSTYRLLKLAYIHSNLKNYSKSLFLYRLAAKRCVAAAPLAYEYIGEIEKEMGRKQNQLTAYRTVLGYRIPLRYRNSVFEKIRGIVENDTTELKKAPWLDDYYKWLAPQKRPEVVSRPALIDSLVDIEAWAKIDSLLDTVALGKEEGCRVAASAFDAGSQALLSSKNLFSLAIAAFSCGKDKAADNFLRLIGKRKNYQKTISDRRYIYLRGQVSYNLGKYDEAIKYFKKYENRYGADPELIMYIARAYRKLGKEDESAQWYQKHLELYPTHPRTQEILWLRAWQKEERKDFTGAADVYKTLFTKYAGGKRSEESYLRYALCFYRLEKYDTSRVFLDKFLSKYPYSSLFQAAKFWKGKCLLALDKTDSAAELFSQIIESDPFDYYSHRAGQLMVLLGDTSTVETDSIFDIHNAIDWLDSVSPSSKKPLSENDSIDFLRGLYLASLGAAEEADFFLEPLELSFPGNLKLQFELAALYSLSNAPAQAYRIARRLTWRIPSEKRGEIPLAVYDLLYPQFFSGTISDEALDNNVDSYLVSAVIRQESIFNPRIVSPAGAIGLMQLMPYTAKHVAGRLDEPFSNDSLYYPGVNIRYGVCYLRELLDQFNDNIILVLAGYNGGPHNAQKWYERNKDEEFDLFIEDIAFTETRGYVKRVLGNYWTYRALGNKTSLVSGLSRLCSGSSSTNLPSDSSISESDEP